MSYLRQGINYGIGQLDDLKIEQDLDFLRQHFRYIRISYPTYDSTSLPYWQDICVRARRKGLRVVWGISAKPLTSANIDAFCAKYVELAPWAAKYGIVLGMNEEMLHNNDTEISDAVVLAKIKEAAQIAKTNIPNVKTILSVAGSVGGTGEMDKLIAGGKGAFDYVGINQFGFLAEHKANVDKLVAAFGGYTSVTEFNTGRGFDTGYGTDESRKADIKARMDYAHKSKVGTATTDIATAYFYTYAHNSEKGTNGSIKWDIRTTDSPRAHHPAFDIFKRRHINVLPDTKLPVEDLLHADARFVEYNQDAKNLRVSVDQFNPTTGVRLGSVDMEYNIQEIKDQIALNAQTIAQLQEVNENYQQLLDGFAGYTT